MTAFKFYFFRQTPILFLTTDSMRLITNFGVNSLQMFVSNELEPGPARLRLASERLLHVVIRSGAFCTEPSRTRAAGWGGFSPG